MAKPIVMADNKTIGKATAEGKSGAKAIRGLASIKGMYTPLLASIKGMYTPLLSGGAKPGWIVQASAST